MELILASANPHKVEEIRKVLPPQLDIQIQSLKDINFTEEIPETQNTLEGNASQKAWYLYDRLNKNVFSEDTGLEIQALDGAPGVKTARYAGEEKNADNNMNLVLTNLQNASNRKAQFRTIIALIIDGKEIQFEGKVEGKIAERRLGDGGFGYDPIFIPDGFIHSFGQLHADVKNGMSHRSRAFEKMIQYLLEKGV